MDGWFWVVASWFATLLGPADADPACLVLGGLDLVRAEAFASARPELLDRVYADPALRRRDEAVLSAWAGRDLAVDGAGLQRLSCRVVERAGGRVVLDVVDRLGPASAVGASGATALPRDEPTRRRVTLVERADAWRVGRSG